MTTARPSLFYRSTASAGEAAQLLKALQPVDPYKTRSLRLAMQARDVADWGMTFEDVDERFRGAMTPNDPVTPENVCTYVCNSIRSVLVGGGRDRALEIVRNSLRTTLRECVTPEVHVCFSFGA